MNKYSLLLFGLILILAFGSPSFAQTPAPRSPKIIFMPFNISNPGKVTFNVNNTFFISLKAELAKYGATVEVPEENYIDSLAEEMKIDMVTQDNAESLAKAMKADIFIFGQIWEFSTDESGNAVVNASIYMIDGKNGSIISTIKYLPGNFYFGLQDKTPFKIVENIASSLVDTLRMWKYI